MTGFKSGAPYLDGKIVGRCSFPANNLGKMISGYKIDQSYIAYINTCNLDVFETKSNTLTYKLEKGA